MGKNQTTLLLPYEMKLAWDTNSIVRKISIHEKVHDSAKAALTEILEIYGNDIEDLGLDLFGGCLNVRKMRGGSNWSMHSWGIAIDFDPENNQLKWGDDKARLAGDDYIPFWEAWEKQNWVSLGRTKNYDWMHVQAARL